jgi:hypothetical protein
MAGAWILEQPRSSRLIWHPRVRHVFRMMPKVLYLKGQVNIFLDLFLCVSWKHILEYRVIVSSTIWASVQSVPYCTPKDPGRFLKPIGGWLCMVDWHQSGTLHIQIQELLLISTWVLWWNGHVKPCPSMHTRVPRPTSLSHLERSPLPDLAFWNKRRDLDST